MKNKSKKLLKALFSVIISFVLCFCVQITVHLNDRFQQLIMLAAVFICAFFVSFVLKYSVKRYFVSLLSIIAVTGILCVSFLGIHHHYEPLSKYSNADDYTDLCKDKTVLLIVPHEDDDLNVFSGLIDFLPENSNKVFIAFTTNGDSYNLGETRLNESLAVAKYYNIPESNIVFLGYANGWAPNAAHIYNSDPDTVLTSKIGRTETYGIKNHPAYKEGTPYTRNNLKNDLKDLIFELSPDIIFAVDCDFHADHRMTSLIFEEAMGEMLAQNSGYKPLVYKAFAYSTAYYGVFDFYQKNIYSTKVNCENGCIPDINIYKWSDRVRFPVSSKSLSRYLKNTSTYETLDMYASQCIITQAEGIINGDKVFWKRNTNSILYNADIAASSGNAERINDFKLLDYNDVSKIKALPYDGVWVPESTDKDKKVKIGMNQPSDVCAILLYDNPSMDNNILNAEIEFDNGAKIQTGKLEANGSATTIMCNQKNVKSFEVSIKESEGRLAGFTEIEAYDGSTDDDFVRIMKVVNSNDDFVYDYYIDKSGQEDFSLYKYNCAPVKDSDYEISCSNQSCSAVMNDGCLTVNCPKGQSCSVSVSDKKNNVADTISVSNPNDIILRNLARIFDKMYNHTYSLEKQKEYYNSLKSEVYEILVNHAR